MGESKTNTEQISKAPELKDWLILLMLSIIWGSSFILIKKSLVGLSYVEVGVLRILISFIAFSPLLIIMRKHIQWDMWLKYIIISLIGIGFPAFLYALAQTQISSIVSGILNSLTPLFTILIGVLFFAIQTKRRQYFGVIVGLVGALLIMLVGKAMGASKNMMYSLLVVIATIGYAFNVNYIKRHFQNHNPIALTAISLFIIGIPALIAALMMQIPQHIMSDSVALTSFGYLIILALASTAFASVFYYKLVQSTSALFASSVTYIMPAIILLWGLLDGEVFSTIHFLGLALIIAGVYLTRS